jgi:GAF domain-containing protein
MKRVKFLVETLDLEDILNRVAEQAWLFTGRRGQHARSAKLLLVKENKLLIMSTFPKQPKESPRAVKSGNLQLVGEAKGDIDLINSDPTIHSELYVSIKIGNNVIGFIDVEHPDIKVFDEEDKRTLEALAAQAAIAIQNARLYKEAERRAILLATASEVAREATAILKIEELLHQAVVLISERFGFYHAGIFLLDKTEKYAVLKAASSNHGKEMLKQEYQLAVGEVGIVGFVAKSREARISLDVDKDDVYFDNPFLPDTHSEIALPLQVDGRLIGVLDVQSKDFNAFNDDDKVVLQTMADHLAVTIKKSQQYRELEQTQGLVGTRTALAWMGMASSEWRHSIGNYATTIEDYVEHARQDIAEKAPVPKILGRLERIDNIVNKIRDAPITAPLHSEEGVTSVNINELLEERIKQIWQRESYHDVLLSRDFLLSPSITVRVSPDWLRRAFDILIENSAEAMNGKMIKHITIVTQLENQGSTIKVTDTGNGIPIDVRPHVFQNPISKLKGSKGLGMGLLIAHLIVQTYGGDLSIYQTGLSGTTMKIWLPIEP